ncbi:MAG: glycosyltransferase [Saprospiraceae bacterium]|nr:glycosyltransferase [Saprospiraceae bacterium]
MTKKKIIICMTSDWKYDQRMQRIFSALQVDYQCKILHRPKKPKLVNEKLAIEDIRCYFKKGALFYAEFNFRLFVLLMKERADLYYAVDADTLAGVGLAAKLKRIQYVFDSHEWFTEVPELEQKNGVKKIWSAIESWAIPGASLCLTVNESLANLFQLKWQKPFHAILNVPVHSVELPSLEPVFVIIYQGAVNKGRGLECAIDAMQYLENYTLQIAGDGDLKEELENYIGSLPWKDRIRFLGKLTPDELKSQTKKARYGLNLLDGKSKNYYYSLANKFFDYWQAGIPSINMDFPEYRRFNDKYNVGLIISELNSKNLANLINYYDHSEEYAVLRANCLKHRSAFTWEKEAEKLLTLFRSLFT